MSYRHLLTARRRLVLVLAHTQWHQSFSLRRYIDLLRNGQATPAFETIHPHEGAKEAQALDKAWEARLAKDLALAAQQAALQQEILNIGDDAIHTKTNAAGMIPLDLLERLTRYQAIIGRICQRFRLVKIIITWEESFVSFWLTACLLGTGLVSLLLPWSFLLLWTGRIVVYGFCGPHMMLVDRLLSSSLDDNDGAGESALEKAMTKFKDDVGGARIRRQEALKLRDMKCLAFGKYITLVPTHNLSRHFDRPLPTSFATRCCRPERKMASVEVPGQHLFGTVLPRPEADLLQYNQESTRLVVTQEKIKNYLADRACQGSEAAACLDERGVSEDEVKSLLPIQSVDADDDVDQSSAVAIIIPSSSLVEAEAGSNVGSTRTSSDTGADTGPDIVPTAMAVDNTETRTVSSRKKIHSSFPHALTSHTKKQQAKRRVHALLASLHENYPSDDEARESGEVEIVLSSSGLERDEADRSDADDEEEESVSSSSEEPMDWRVLFFQPNT
jgi:hypothetical protein